MIAGVSSVRVGGEAEIDVAALLSAALSFAYATTCLQQRKVHQRLAAEEGDVNRTASGRLLQQKIHRSLGRLEIHELRLAFGRGHLVFAEFVAIRAGQIALVGEIQHQGLQREDPRAGLHRSRTTASPVTITRACNISAISSSASSLPNRARSDSRAD